MPKGTVKWFSNQRGYGFITPESGNDIFVHFSAITGEGYKTLDEGDQVEFEITQGPKGEQATNVKRLEGGGAAPESSGDQGSQEGQGSQGSEGAGRAEGGEGA